MTPWEETTAWIKGPSTWLLRGKRRRRRGVCCHSFEEVAGLRRISSHCSQMLPVTIQNTNEKANLFITLIGRASLARFRALCTCEPTNGEGNQFLHAILREVFGISWFGGVEVVCFLVLGEMT
jgi:hypothetical protein